MTLTVQQPVTTLAGSMPRRALHRRYLRLLLLLALSVCAVVGMFNLLVDPPVPHDVEYASLIESDEPVVVQHTRLDSRQAANALLSTIAHPLSEEP